MGLFQQPARGVFLVKRQQFQSEGLARMLAYVLGRRPDEFGLVPDPEGFVPIKDLIQALHEEPDWTYVRQGHIQEVLVGKERHAFENIDDRLRAVVRSWSWPTSPLTAAELPRLLLVPIRRRAHPVVMDRGLSPTNENPLVLSKEKDMALRIGRRRDPEPVLIEVLAVRAAEEGMAFLSFGDLFLAKDIPVRFIAGPPVSKEVMEELLARRAAPPEPALPVSSFTPGTFALDLSRGDLARRKAGKKAKGWKEAARSIRKEKRQ
jgi:putative RNA 2'-phosphotransferase